MELVFLTIARVAVFTGSTTYVQSLIFTNIPDRYFQCYMLKTQHNLFVVIVSYVDIISCLEYV